MKNNPNSGNPMHRKVVLTNPKNGTKPKAAGGKKPAVKPKAKPMSIGFNPQKMAQTMTNLGYGTDIAETQRAITQSQAQEEEALKDLQGWASQIEDQRATGAAQASAAWDQGIGQAQVGQANINQLFGGAGGSEGAQYGQAGLDMLQGLSASDKAFDARMQPILGAQSLDYKRRASGEFNSQQKELQGHLGDLQKEKGQAYQKNLMDMMDMAWGRKQDILQYQTGQQALKQAAALQGYELAGAQQGLVKGQQDIQQGNLSIKAQRLAIKKSTLDLKKVVNNPNGVDWNDPATRSNIGNAAFSGAMSPRNTFGVSPKVALANAMTALAQMGLASDPRAVAAVRNSFAQILRLSHAHKQWTKWHLNKKGQLVHSPAGKGPAVIKGSGAVIHGSGGKGTLKPGKQTPPPGGWPASAFNN
jgi:hypothetical protein